MEGSNAFRTLSTYQLGVLGPNEVRLPGQFEFRASGGLYSGNPESGPRKSGVNFLLSKSTKESLLHLEAVNDRNIWECFHTRFRNITILQCYAPTDIRPPEIKGHFSDILYNTMNKEDITIVLDDFNAKTASPNVFLEDIMGNMV